jgi:hypothetical protein
MWDAARILARALRLGHAAPTVEGASVAGQVGVLVIDEQLHPRGVTEAAGAWFALLDARQKPEQTPLPIHVCQVVGRLLAAEAGEDPRRPPRVRVRASDGHWAIVEAARLEGAPDTIAVSIYAAGADDVLALVSRVYGLTAREREPVALQRSPQICVRQARDPQPSRTRHRAIRTSRITAIAHRCRVV